jgi:monofunctional biosynthetic peptidoglycan transglycosylase
MAEVVQHTSDLPREPSPTPRARRPALRWIVQTGKWAVRIAAGYYLLCILLLVVYRFMAPPITGVQLERRIEGVLGRDEYTERKHFVTLDRIPAHVGHAVVAAEDGRFFSHWGFDLDAMRDAATELMDGERVRGASTITQQLVKNLFGCTCRNPVRKLFDYALTPAAELVLGKGRILELYLNEVEWGPGVFGVDAAARYHYGEGVRGLSRAQAAGLAALLPNPLERSPENTPEYRASILRRMDHRGW